MLDANISKTLKVLVVDDELDCRQFAKSVLESKLSARVITANNGEED